MTKGKKAKDPVSEARRRAQFAALQQRAAETTTAGPRRVHIEPVDLTGREGEYEDLLFAVESALIEVHDAGGGLLVDADMERAMRECIARLEGDHARRSGSADVDALVDAVEANLEAVQLQARGRLRSAGEVVGAFRRVIEAIRTWHEPTTPRAYLMAIGDYIREELAARRASQARTAGATASRLWTPGRDRDRDRDRAQPPASDAPAPPRASGLWLPGDR